MTYKKMEALKILKENVSKKFVNAKVEGTGKKAPRPGYYFIRSIFYETIEPFGEICIGNVNWKLNEDDLFVEDLIFPIALSNLSSAKPEETLGFKTEEDLVDKIIYIFNPQIVQRNFNGEEKKVVKCLWQLVHQEPNFITSDNALLHSLCFGRRPEDTTLAQVVESFQKNSSYDVTVAEENESLFGNKSEVYIEDAAWLNDEFIEDTDNTNDPRDDNDDDQPLVPVN